MNKFYLVMTVVALAFCACSDDSSTSISPDGETIVESSLDEVIPKSSSEKSEDKGFSSAKSDGVKLSSSSEKKQKSSSSEKHVPISSSNVDTSSSEESSSNIDSSSSVESSSNVDTSSSVESSSNIDSSSSVESSSNVDTSSSVESSSSVKLSSSSVPQTTDVDELVPVNEYGYAIAAECSKDEPYDMGAKFLARALLADDFSTAKDMKKGYLLEDGNGRYQLFLPEASDYCEVINAKVKMKREGDTLSIEYDFGESGGASKCRCYKDHWFDIDAQNADISFVKFGGVIFEIVEKD